MMLRSLAAVLLLCAAAHATPDPCALTPDAGLCKARFIRYFFDQTTNSCKSFVYGGCGGVVPFTTAADCEAAQCAGADPCTVEPETGPCRARFIRYFFDQTTNSCSTFTWGGCKGVVPFKSAAACEAAQCPCTLLPERGRCRARKPRYFWNGSTQVCFKLLLQFLFFVTSC